MAKPERPAGLPAEPPRVSKRFFYAGSLTDAERVDLADAAGVEGLDDEIAVLRVRLKTALEKQPEDYALMVRGIGLLVRAVSAQYRLSPRASKDLGENLARVLNRFGDLTLPADR